MTFYAISAVLYVSVKLLTEIQPLRRLTIFTLSAQPHVSLAVLSKYMVVMNSAQAFGRRKGIIIDTVTGRDSFTVSCFFFIVSFLVL